MEKDELHELKDQLEERDLLGIGGREDQIRRASVELIPGIPPGAHQRDQPPEKIARIVNRAAPVLSRALRKVIHGHPMIGEL